MGSDWIIGVDEAGRGPVIGPLVVAALAIPPDDIEKLSKLQVKDSKELSPNERLRICLLYTSPSPRDQRGSRMPSSA